MSSLTRRKIAAIVLAIVTLGFGLRWWGLRYGLPYIYQPDEATLINLIVRMVKARNPNPEFFHYPSLYFDINALSYVPFYWIGKLKGTYSSLADLPPTRMVAMGVAAAIDERTVVMGRLLSTIASLAGVAATFFVGRRLALITRPDDESRSLWLGGIAALTMAVSPMVVPEAQWTTVDSHVLPWVCISLWAALGILQRERTSDYVICGIAGGLAASVKYNAALALMVLPLAHWISGPSRRWITWRLVLGALCAQLAFGLTSPFIILDWPRFWSDFAYQSLHYATSHPGMEGQSLRFYMQVLFGTEGLICIAGLAGMAVGFAKRHKGVALLSLYSVIYLAFVARFPVRNERTLFPILPACYVVGAWYLLRMGERIARRRAFASRPVWLREALLALALVVLWLAPVATTISHDIERSTVDSRTTAAQWIAAEVPEGSTICIEAYTPYVDPLRYNVVTLHFACRQTPQWYIDQGCEYVILGEWAYQRYFDDPAQYAEQVAGYRAVLRAFPLERQFDDGGYTVKVLRVPQPADS